MHLTVAGLALSRGGRTLQADLDFRVAAGEALALTGPNGVGKTTLLRALAGFIRPDSGTIALAGGDDDLTVGEQCHFIGHLNGIKPGLTVAENTTFWATYLGGSADTEPALDRLNLTAIRHIPAAYLSAGQKRRLGLARLLLAERPLWLLDEPTVSLDETSRRILADMIDAHVAAGGMAIIATHLPLGLSAQRHLVLSPRRPAA